MARAAAKKVKPRKRLTGDERRESILEAALGCFLEKGYIATTINDIREASGATTGSIYHFFDGKGALAMALLEDAVAGWSGESQSSSEAPEAVIKASAAGLVSWGLKNPELFRFMDEIRTLAVTARNSPPSPTPSPKARARLRRATRSSSKPARSRTCPGRPPIR